MTASIPASQIVNVTPSVISSGGSSLGLNAVYLTEDTSVPIGTLKSFATLTDVKSWFGSDSDEAALAAVYFSGYSTGTILPNLLYFSQYNSADVAGYLRGGAQTGVTLTDLQALSGTFTLSLDGVSTVSDSINLASATSFSNAAALIQVGLRAGVPTNTATVTYDSQRAAFVVGSSTTGDSSSVGFAATGALATGLKLTSAAGATLSPGADATTPGAAMDAIVALSQNWVSFLTVFEPDTATKLLFSVWTSQVTEAGSERFVYAAWDSDTGPLAGDDPTSFGAQVVAADYNGTVPIYDPDGKKAAFLTGWIASLDTTRNQGRATAAFKSQSGLTADITNATQAANLVANGYNYYGSYATANDEFTFLYPGSMPGEWKWVDAYVNQVWMNAAFQLALMELLTTVGSIPYNQRGYNLIRAALLDPIDAAVNFGAIQPGVTLSNQQAQIVNSQAGITISDTLNTVGWYLQITPASAITRGQRGSPTCTFWYTDGGSVQKINLASIDIQ